MTTVVDETTEKLMHWFDEEKEDWRQERAKTIEKEKENCSESSKNHHSSPHPTATKTTNVSQLYFYSD